MFRTYACDPKRMTAQQYVPRPMFQEGAATDGLMAPSNARGEKRRFKDMEKQTLMRVQAFKKYADRFTVPTTIAHLQSVRTSSDTKLLLDLQCTEILEPQPYSRPFSAMYYDKDQSLLFSYMGERWKQGLVEVSFHRLLIRHILIVLYSSESPQPTSGKSIQE